MNLMNRFWLISLLLRVSFSSSSFTEVKLNFLSCFLPMTSLGQITSGFEDSTNTIEQDISINEQMKIFKVTANYKPQFGGSSCLSEDRICESLRIKTIPTDPGSSVYIYLFGNPDDAENIDTAFIKSEEQYINQIHFSYNERKSFCLKNTCIFYLRVQCQTNKCNFRLFFQLVSSPFLKKNEITYFTPGIDLYSNFFILRDLDNQNAKGEYYHIFIEVFHSSGYGNEANFASYINANNNFEAENSLLLNSYPSLDDYKYIYVFNNNNVKNFHWKIYRILILLAENARIEVRTFNSDKHKFSLNTVVLDYIDEGKNNEECFILSDKLIQENDYTLEVGSNTFNIEVDFVDEKGNVIPQKTFNVTSNDIERKTLKGKELINTNICFKSFDSKLGGFTFEVLGDASEETDSPEEIAPPNEEIKTSKKSKTGLIAGVCVAVVVVLGGAGGVAVYFLKIRKIKTNQSNVKETNHSRLDTDRPINTEQIEPTKVQVQK